MPLQHKRELRRLASKNFATAANGTTNRLPQPHLPPHQRPLQQMDQLQPIQPQQPAPWKIVNQPNYPDHYQMYLCGGNSRDSSSMTRHNCNELQLNTPPPQPYSCIPVYVDYSGMFRQQPNYATDAETETSVSATESEVSCLQKCDLERTVSGIFNNYENIGGDMLVDNYEQQSPPKNKNSSSFTFKKFPKQMRRSSPPPTTNPSSTETVPTTARTTLTFAAKILRNCCFAGTETSTGLAINNNKNMNRKLCHETQLPPVQAQLLETLLTRLSGNQDTVLLKAVESRADSTSTVGARNFADCILIRRGLISNEEPYVVAYRLFFWAHLKDATQLKRLPVCLNDRDPVYVCCNPLHWCRILETETAPPPYEQRSEMERLKTEDTVSGENSQNGGNSITASIGSSISSNSILKSDLRVRIPESQSTDGEDRGTCLSPEWCQVAYWELKHHIGDIYKAKKPSINIYVDGPCSGGIGEEMCLKDLIAKCPKESPEDVQHTRQKIGLGVTLSQEADGVWLYNRSTVPIFVHSPTLSENYSRICRVMPGDCLKAFDSQRARSIIYPSNYGGVQPGPIHRFSMQISFAKGWGRNYKRQDIIKCPCRLEVFFPQR